MMLDELEAKEMLARFGVPVNPGFEVDSADDAVKKAEGLGFPVVMKVLSSKIIHKSDLGLVELDICSEACVREAYGRISEKALAADPDSKVVVSSMAAEGVEVIIGAKRDPQFGPTVLFGLGGVFVEVFKDVSIRVAPVDKRMALEMIKEIKGYLILKGFRGKKPADIDALADIVVSVSGLAMEMGNVMELDVNPVMAYEDGAVAVDARIKLRD
jgi:acyl-CoA synthetase (NDP forming)